jgi:hypothetical protein
MPFLLRFVLAAVAQRVAFRQRGTPKGRKCSIFLALTHAEMHGKIGFKP